MEKDAQSLQMLRRYADHAGFRALFLKSDETKKSRCVDVDRVADGLIFETNWLGNIACGFGVQIETVAALAEWLQNPGAASSRWRLLDLLSLVRATPDGEIIPNIRPHRTHYETIREAFEQRKNSPTVYGKELPNALEIENVHLQATLLALLDWSDGVRLWMEPIHGEEQGLGIEERYGLAPYGSSVRDRAKDYARLLRVMDAIASSLDLSGSQEEEPGWIRIPQDLSVAVEVLNAGMPTGAVDLARTGIDGLSRTWALDLYETMEENRFEPDLPVVERLRLFSEETEFFQTVPTPGLGQRIKTELESTPRSPIAEALRHSPDAIVSFYQNPLVKQAQILQGGGRYTGLKMSHRRAYAVIRRNSRKRVPIRIETDAHYEEWIEKGAVEFLSEVGFFEGSQYYIDRFLTDLDPRNGFPMDRLRALALEIGDRFGSHEWVEDVYYHWTGGRGFHIIGEFKAGILQSPDQTKRVLEVLIDRLTDDVHFFSGDQPWLEEPYVVLDLKPVMRRGLYRNGLSLNANTGGICIPLTESEMKSVEDPKKVELAIMTDSLEAGSYSEFVRQVQKHLFQEQGYSDD